MKLIKLGFLIIVVLISVGVAYALSTFTVERFFFDRMIYQKSEKFGYIKCWVNECTLNEFGNRGADLQELVRANEKVLGLQTADEQSMEVAVIGDSFTWGQGVKKEQTFVEILKQKLSNELRANIRSYAMPGDNTMQHIQKVRQLEKTSLIDLYVIVPTDSDISMNKNYWYDTHLPPMEEDEIYQACLKLTQTDYVIDIKDNPKDPGEYVKNIDRAWESVSNRCVIQGLLDLLYKSNKTVIFFFPEVYEDCAKDLSSGCRYINMIKPYGFKVLTAGELSRDSCCMALMPKDRQALRVSEIEGHPSALAYRLYALYLAQNIEDMFLNKN